MWGIASITYFHILNQLYSLTMFLRKLYSLAITCLLAVPVFSQDTIPAPVKCFPSGTSLIGARSSISGRYVIFNNVREIWKVFDLQTGMIVSKSDRNSIAATIDPYEYDLDPTSRPLQYGYQRRKPSASNPNEGVEVVLNSKVVMSVDVPYSWDVALNTKNGDLIVASASREWHWIRLGGERRKLKTKGKVASGLSYEYMFSNDGKYFITKWGDLADLENDKVTGNAFPGVTSTENFNVSMNADGKTFTWPNGSESLRVFDLSSGKLVETIPVPAELPRINGFTILALPDPHSYVYWLDFNSKAASGGLAYYVKDGVSLSLCDPNWLQEQTDNIVGMLTDWKAREDEAERKRRLAAIEYEKRRKQREQYLIDHPQDAVTAPKLPKYVTTTYNATCNYCKGAGTITYENLTPAPGRTSQTVYSVDYYGNRTYVTNNYGYTTKKCGACKGSGTIKVTNKTIEQEEE